MIKLDTVPTLLPISLKKLSKLNVVCSLMKGASLTVFGAYWIIRSFMLKILVRIWVYQKTSNDQMLKYLIMDGKGNN